MRYIEDGPENHKKGYGRQKVGGNAWGITVNVFENGNPLVEGYVNNVLAMIGLIGGVLLKHPKINELETLSFGRGKLHRSLESNGYRTQPQ